VSDIAHKLLPPEEVAASAPEPGDALLYVEGVSVSFDGFKALNDLNFYASARQMEAVIGPNGAGKTTMMDVISGKTKPDQGRLIFRGDVDLTKLDEAAIANLGIGRKFQKPTVFENHTVFDNLELALKGDRGVFHAVFKRLAADELVRIEEVLGIISLSDHARRRAGDLSHGQKQWLEIGMLLMQDPELLMVDEPVAGMTDAETEQTAQLLRHIAETHSVMVVEHDMDFVRARHPRDRPPRRLGHRPRPPRQRSERRARDRDLSRALSDAGGPGHRSALRRQPGPAANFDGSPDRRSDLRAGPQWRRQDQPAAGHRRPAQGQQRADSLGEHGYHDAAGAPPRRGRDRLRAPGPRDLSPAHRGGEPAHRLCRRATGVALHP